jgi:hypothetical protein
MSKPTIQERSREKVCPNCGNPAERKSNRGPPPIFCSKVCKRDMNNRLTVEGRALVAFAKAWRIDRGSGEIAQRALAQLCDIADLFNARDLEAGRPRADLYAAKLLSEMFVTRGTRYIDRETPKSKVSA